MKYIRDDDDWDYSEDDIYIEKLTQEELESSKRRWVDTLQSPSGIDFRGRKEIFTPDADAAIYQPESHQAELHRDRHVWCVSLENIADPNWKSQYPNDGYKHPEFLVSVHKKFTVEEIIDSVARVAQIIQRHSQSKARGCCTATILVESDLLHRQAKPVISLLLANQMIKASKSADTNAFQYFYSWNDKGASIALDYGEHQKQGILGYNRLAIKKAERFEKVHQDVHKPVDADIKPVAPDRDALLGKFLGISREEFDQL